MLNAEEIAHSLTEAQRAILATDGTKEVSPLDIERLHKLNLLQQRLTPLGLEVRKLLTSDQVTDTLDKPL